MSDWVIVPCPASRVAELQQLLTDLAHPASNVVVVTTLPHPVEAAQLVGLADHLVLWPEPGMTIGLWMNAGLDHIASIAPLNARYAFITGSDTRADPGVLGRLTAGMERLGLVMGGPGAADEVLSDPRERTLWRRVSPEFFMLDLRHGLRYDPEFRWWYDADDLEMQARQVGPVGLIAEVGLHQALWGHDLSPTQQQHAIEDRAKFVTKWGQEPW